MAVRWGPYVSSAGSGAAASLKPKHFRGTRASGLIHCVQHRMVHFARCNLGRFVAPRFIFRAPTYSPPIPCLLKSAAMGAVRAAEILCRLLHAMPYNPTAATRTTRRKRLYCALKAVECGARSPHDDIKTLVVFISAHNASSHIPPQVFAEGSTVGPSSYDRETGSTLRGFSAHERASPEEEP